VVRDVSPLWTQQGEANYTATKEETVIYVGKNQGLDNEQTKKMRKKINKLEVNAAQASVEMSDLREASVAALAARAGA